MAQIRRLGPVHHLRSDASMYILRYRRGVLRRSGRGQSFFFLPHSSSIAEVPVDDREMPLSFRSRSSDYQEVTAQGVVTFRVRDPRRLADRIDFTIDLSTGVLLRQPLEKLALLFSQIAEQRARAWVASVALRRVLGEGPTAPGPRLSGPTVRSATASGRGQPASPDGGAASSASPAPSAAGR